METGPAAGSPEPARTLRLALAAALWPGIAWAVDAPYPAFRQEPPALAAQAAVKSLPAQAQTELFSLYARYHETVAKRQEEGWRAGLLTGEIVETADDNPLPMRQIEEAADRRTAEIQKLDGDIKQSLKEDDILRLHRRRAAARTALDGLNVALKRARGICLDWSDLIWAELRRLQPAHWDIRDAERKARPFHTGAVLCAPADVPAVCLVFDPWERGQSDVYEFRVWDTGSFAARLPADFFLHQLPEPRPAKGRKP